MCRYYFSLFCLVFSVLGLANAQGSEKRERGFYSERERGFFWYEMEEEETPPEPKNEPIASEKSPEKEPEKALSVEHLRKVLPKLRDAAINNPTDEKAMLRYYVAQRIMLDKATQFADQTRLLYMKHPSLSENKLMPVQSAALQLKRREARENTEKVIAELANKASLFYFYTASCQYCVKFGPLIKQLMDNTGLSVMPVSLDGLPPSGGFEYFRLVSEMPKALINKFDLSSTPTVYMIDNNSLEMTMITNEYASLSQLSEKIIMLAHEKKWISREQMMSTREAKREDFIKTHTPDREQSDLSNDAYLDALIEDAFNLGNTEQAKEQQP
ncbi:conjugal transfer protein TraF [Pseudoalteromonas sp. T1lg23B]|uniref:conjugal transfer protein TraF n=1 Tax=Pseudoalteromonas sp. T1lg23B TaxID=2077097 RepID=UPI000CF6E315|nr:conjugal transfer protein TraF [Pseudoalteromonas sp. T1lg23B]